MTRLLSLRARRIFGGRNLLIVAVSLLFVLLLTFAACSTSAADTVEHPTESSEVVLQVSTGGGFVPVEYNLMHTPEFTLFGDGTVIVTGPMIEIYPQPALHNLQTTAISEEAVQKILGAAQEAGLFNNGIDYGQPAVADLPTTTITVNTGEQTYTSAIYALGTEQDAGGLTPAQKQARADISDFLGRLFDLGVFQTQAAEWQEYDFAALAIYSLPVDPSTTPDYTEVQPNRLEWPLLELSALGEPVQPQGYKRLIVSGEDLDALQPLLDQATQITLWISGDSEYHLYFKPLLPNETS